jgi:hypothetical protein
MGSAEHTVDTAHWGIALFSDKLYIFLVITLFSRKGYV